MNSVRGGAYARRGMPGYALVSRGEIYRPHEQLSPRELGTTPAGVRTTAYVHLIYTFATIK